ncbi:hypothetical protein GIB67_018293, partial [Kingdonia uniflora]
MLVPPLPPQIPIVRGRGRGNSARGGRGSANSNNESGTSTHTGKGNGKNMGRATATRGRGTAAKTGRGTTSNTGRGAPSNSGRGEALNIGRGAASNIGKGSLGSSIKFDGHTMELKKTSNLTHTCRSKAVDKNKLAHAGWVAKEVEELIRSVRSTRPCDVQEAIWTKYGVHVSYHTAWNAWTICIQRIVGSYDEALHP